MAPAFRRDRIVAALSWCWHRALAATAWAALILAMTSGFAAVVWGGSRAPQPPPTAAPAIAGHEAAVPPAQLEAMRAAAADLLSSLKTELQAALAGGDVAAGVAACSEHALSHAARVSLANGWRVTRVSLKPRNALLGTADAWEQKQLLQFDAAVAAGADPATLEVAEVVAEPAGSYVRYLKALPTAGLCVTCHGPVAGLPEALKATLAERYPYDRAVGYLPGSVRGAVSIKVPL